MHCVGGIVFPLPQGIAGKVHLPGSTHLSPARKGSTGMLSAPDKWGHRGSRLHSRLIVLEALICQGSAGNQVGIYSALFNVYWPAHSRKEDIWISSRRTPALHHPAPPPREDALMIKLFLVCVFSSVWRWAHPSYLLVSPSKMKPASKTDLKYAFSHANTRMFGNFSPQVVVTSGFARCQGSANNKTEATSKIIKVSFLRTSIEL